MRLLLDEMYSGDLAVELRRRGHDVIAVVERDDLREQDDEQIFHTATEDRRVLMTENAKHLRPLVDRYHAEGVQHYGLLCVSARSLPRVQQEFGTLLRSIEAYLREHSAEDALLDSVDWLTPGSG